MYCVQMVTLFGRIHGDLNVQFCFLLRVSNVLHNELKLDFVEPSVKFKTKTVNPWHTVTLSEPKGLEVKKNVTPFIQCLYSTHKSLLHTYIECLKLPIMGSINNYYGKIRIKEYI